MAEWYLVPLMPFWLLGFFAGLATISFRLAPRRTARLPVALGSLIAIAQIAGLNWGRDPSRPALVSLAVRTEREALYRQAAGFLKPRLHAEDLVAASEIGAIGYYCECRILDTVGLVSPEAVRYYPLSSRLYAVNYAVPPDLIRDVIPDYVVSLDAFVRNSLLKDDWFNREYRVVWEADTRIFDSRKLLVFARKG